LTQCIEALKPYKKYITVTESISALHTSRTLIEIHISKYNKFIEENKDKVK
jgi:hypothetical protein